MLTTRWLFLVAFSNLAYAQFPATCPDGTPNFSGDAVAIDNVGGCSMEGADPGRTGDKLKAELAQNRAKNNFCAQGTAAPVTLKVMANLQKSVTDGNLVVPTEPPVDRSKLVDLGEGKRIQFTGFVFEARQEEGESVNCGSDSPDVPASHDIHISLLQAKRKTNPKDKAHEAQAIAEECGSIVAEMSPHHRLPEWNSCNVNTVAGKGLLVRVTGQQFFDASHVPCKNGKPVGSQPKRVSLW